MPENYDDEQTDETTDETTTVEVTPDRSTLYVGSAMICLLWLIVSSFTLLLIFKSPTKMSTEDVGNTLFLAAVVAALGTGFLARMFF